MRSGSVVAYLATNDEAHVSVVLSLALKVVCVLLLFMLCSCKYSCIWCEETGICSLCHFGEKNKLFEVLSIVLFCCLRGKHYYIAINISDCFFWEKTKFVCVPYTHLHEPFRSCNINGPQYNIIIFSVCLTLTPWAYLYFFLHRRPQAFLLMAFRWQNPSILLSHPFASLLSGYVLPFFPLSPSLLPFLRTHSFIVSPLLFFPSFFVTLFSSPFLKCHSKIIEIPLWPLTHFV